MSVCVSSSLNSGMTSHVSHLHMTSALMHPFQNHQMPIDMAQHNHQSQSQSNSQMQNAVTNENEPNPEMLLALIARNKTLEGKKKFFVVFHCRRKVVLYKKKREVVR